MDKIQTALSEQIGIQYPIICGAMFPCSNPELVAAVSEAGGIGVVQPLSMEFIYDREIRAGLKYIKTLTKKPIGFNLTVERSTKRYAERMERYLDVALEEGCQFFVTAMGKPGWVVEKAKKEGAIVYHKCTFPIHAEKAKDQGVDGLIIVSKEGGGHVGVSSVDEIWNAFSPLGLPLVLAGGLSTKEDFCSALQRGYSGILMGTRFIATTESAAIQDYKDAIVSAKACDIVHTERLTGEPIAVIRTPQIERVGTKVGPIARYLFANPKTKGWIRGYYNTLAAISMKRSALKKRSTKDYWQAGMSVEKIDSIESAGEIVREFSAEARKQGF